MCRRTATSHFTTTTDHLQEELSLKLYDEKVICDKYWLNIMMQIG